jgi:hypothetical protein
VPQKLSTIIKGSIDRRRYTYPFRLNLKIYTIDTIKKPNAWYSMPELKKMTPNRTK